MAADLHIHIMEGIDESHLACQFSNTIGSKWGPQAPDPDKIEDLSQDEAMKMMGLGPYAHTCQHCKDDPEFEDSVVWKVLVETPNIWIGSVSWLKAGLMEEGDGREYVPEPVELVCDAVGEDLPMLDDELIDEICDALDVPSTANDFYEVTDPQSVREFLEEHKGKRIFTASH